MKTRFAPMLLCGALLAAGASVHAANTMNVATYNLRLNVASDGVNAWPERRDMVEDLVRYHEFDLFATEEGLPGQIDDLARMQEYGHVGAGRDDGKDKGEHSAIFYRRARFELLGHGDFWLSQTPDRPSLGWDATCCNRITSWAELRDKASGQRFYFFATHFDHQGEVARRESAKLILKKIHEIAGAAPVILAGDFNSTPDTEQIRTLSAAMADARAISATKPYGPEGTFNDFKIDAPLDRRIDYVFVSPQVKVLKYAALTDSRHGRFPSDHLPVVVRAEIEGKR